MVRQKTVTANKKLSRRMSQQYLALVIPGMVIFTIGLIIPLILGIYYSFTSWDGLSAEKTFIGFQNYARMIFDKNARSAWAFTFKFTILNTIIQNIVALALAMALDSALRSKKIYRTIFFIPSLISSIVVGFVWLKIFGNVLPALMDSWGLQINTMLFGSQETVLPGLLIANTWQWGGYWMLIYLAALQSIPKDLYEAARIDGSGSVQCFRHITIPMLAPAFTICIVGITTGSLKVYDLLVSSTQGGPGRASTSIIYYIHNAAIGGREYGYGSALSVSLILVLLLIALLQIKSLKKKEVEM